MLFITIFKKVNVMVKLVAFFKLVRWFHEVVVVLPFISLYLIINHVSNQNNITCNFSAWHVLTICFCVQLLIATGCVLNDIVDRDIDKINKPKTHIVDNLISLKAAKRIFIILSLLTLMLSIFISVFIFVEWIYISITVYVLSLAYDLYFKRSPLLGNILMALLTSFIPLVLLAYGNQCLINLHDQKIYLLIYLFAAFPFLIIIPRELSLDISDLEGDKACGCKTLPVLIGAKKSKMVVAIFLLFIIISSIPLAILYQHLVWPLILIDILLVVYLYKLNKVEKRIDYIKIGRFLWFIMILGLVLFSVVTIV